MKSSNKNKYTIDYLLDKNLYSKLYEASKMPDAEPDMAAKVALVKTIAGFFSSISNASNNGTTVNGITGLIRILWDDLDLSAIKKIITFYGGTKLDSSLLSTGIASLVSKKKEAEFEEKKTQLILEILYSLLKEENKDWPLYFSSEHLVECLKSIDNQYLINLIFKNPDNLQKGDTIPSWNEDLIQAGVSFKSIQETVPVFKDILIGIFSDFELLSSFVRNFSIDNFLDKENGFLYELKKDYILDLITSPIIKSVLTERITTNLLKCIFSEIRPLKEFLAETFGVNKSDIPDKFVHIFEQLTIFLRIALNNKELIKNILNELSPNKSFLDQINNPKFVDAIYNLITSQEMLLFFLEMKEVVIISVLSIPLIKKTISKKLGIPEDEILKIAESILPEIKKIISIASKNISLIDSIKKLIQEEKSSPKLQLKLITELVESNAVKQGLQINFQAFTEAAKSSTILSDSIQEKTGINIKEIKTPVISIIQSAIILATNSNLFENLTKIITEADLTKSISEQTFANNQFKLDMLSLFLEPNMLNHIRSIDLGVVVRDLFSSDKLMEKISSIMKSDITSTKVLLESFANKMPQILTQAIDETLIHELKNLVNLFNFDQPIQYQIEKNKKIHLQILNILSTPQLAQLAKEIKASGIIKDCILEIPAVRQAAKDFFNIEDDLLNIAAKQIQDDIAIILTIISEDKNLQKNLGILIKEYNSDMSVLDFLRKDGTLEAASKILTNKKILTMLQNTSEHLIETFLNNSLGKQETKESEEIKSSLNKEISSQINILKSTFEKLDEKKAGKIMSHLPTLANKNTPLWKKMLVVCLIAKVFVQEFGIKATLNIIKTGLKVKKVKKKVSDIKVMKGLTLSEKNSSSTVKKPPTLKNHKPSKSSIREN